MEHEEQGRRLEREADDMEERSEKVGREIEDARGGWESKQSDAKIPGAQSEEDEEREAPDEEES